MSHARAGLRARVELALWRHGLWLPLSLALLMMAGLLVHDARSVEPASQPIASVPLTERAPAVPATTDAQHLHLFHHVLAPYPESTDLVRRLVVLTQPDLAWQQAQFQQADDPALGIVQIQITVPVNGEYRKMRAAIDRALLDIPNLSLDQVEFRRQQASDSQLASRLRFSLWLNAARGGAGSKESTP